MEETISINELRKVKGIGAKTIKRIKEQMRDDDYASGYNPSLHLDRNSVNQGDCLELMNGIPDKSVDMILADLPYGTTACSWDSIIDLDKLWLQYERVIKDNGAIVLTASQPFTSKLIQSNIDWFKYEWIYQKIVGSNFALLKYQPWKEHENIVVFGKGKTKYNPIMEERAEGGKKRLENEYHTNSKNGGKYLGKVKRNNAGKSYNKNLKYPSSVQEFNNRAKGSRGLHPTQKPVSLFEYLIKTYTNEGDLVLDNVAGSGTTGVACKNNNRKYILIEQEEGYYQKSLERIANLETS